MMNQFLTFLRRSVGLTTLAAMLSSALLVDALGGLKLLGGKPPHHHGKVSFNRGGTTNMLISISAKVSIC